MGKLATAQSRTAKLCVPIAAAHYIEHTVNGQSIRALARTAACHPSTILRQVRRVEQRRDDPLIDSALRALAPVFAAKTLEEDNGMKTQTTRVPVPTNDDLMQSDMIQNALPALRRLCENGAVLAVAREMESAVVVRDDGQGGSLRTAVVNRDVAEAMALQDWICCPNPEARIARYVITNAGRDIVRAHVANDNASQTQSMVGALSDEDSLSSRYTAVESPLFGLARRRTKTGEPFITSEMVAAGERLRQDFELAHFPTDASSDHAPNFECSDVDAIASVVAMRQAVRFVLADLGTGLADVAVLCCCLLHGLEATEKRMGWSSRSGKIVLRIALGRLARFYAEQEDKSSHLIG